MMGELLMGSGGLLGPMVVEVISIGSAIGGALSEGLREVTIVTNDGKISASTFLDACKDL